MQKLATIENAEKKPRRASTIHQQQRFIDRTKLKTSYQSNTLPSETRHSGILPKQRKIWEQRERAEVPMERGGGGLHLLKYQKEPFLHQINPFTEVKGDTLVSCATPQAPQDLPNFTLFNTLENLGFFFSWQNSYSIPKSKIFTPKKKVQA